MGSEDAGQEQRPWSQPKGSVDSLHSFCSNHMPPVL